MSRSERIKKKLDVLKPHYFKIIDESYKHTNHMKNAVESHYLIKISSEAFLKQNLLTSHRTINKLLSDEFASGLHALSIKII